MSGCSQTIWLPAGNVDQTDQMRGIRRSWEDWPEKSKSLRLPGFDTDPGEGMPNSENTAIQIQTALNMRRKTTVKTQTSWQLMEEVTHFGGLFIGSFFGGGLIIWLRERAKRTFPRLSHTVKEKMHRKYIFQTVKLGLIFVKAWQLLHLPTHLPDSRNSSAAPVPKGGD